MMGRLEARTAVVTGAGRGIGRAIALRFAREGAKVVISSRTLSELSNVAGEIVASGGTAEAGVADAMAAPSARQPVVRALELWGRADILVNNAGGCIGFHDAFHADDDSFEATLRLNVLSVWWATSAAMPAMREAGFGRVITIGSTESLHAVEGGPAAYVAGKHAVAGMTKQFARDAGASGITVNCICPGWTNTAMVDFEEIARHLGTTAQEARAYAERQCAQNRILEADEIADTALFLASDEAARITGQVISVDGGYRL